MGLINSAKSKYKGFSYLVKSCKVVACTICPNSDRRNFGIKLTCMHGSSSMHKMPEEKEEEGLIT